VAVRGVCGECWDFFWVGAHVCMDTWVCIYQCMCAWARVSGCVVCVGNIWITFEQVRMCVWTYVCVCINTSVCGRV